MKGTYGPNAQRFTSSSLLIVFNRVFSVCVGLVILAYKVSSLGGRPRTARAVGGGELTFVPCPRCAAPSYPASQSRQAPEGGSFKARLRPASSMVAYASVALCNFLSTTCQYEALKYVS